jgi:2-desacetyl-2-hydroxyethyl bacteriochlorophyllide A dehydrogenase
MELRDAPDPKPGRAEVVVEVSYCGICGSDLHEFSSERPTLRAAGMIQSVMGHEFTGQIVAVGEGVDSPRLGDLVVVDPSGPCGTCAYCRGGQSNLCVTSDSVGYGRAGAYADQVLILADQAIALPEASWLERAAFAEPLAVTLRALNRGGLKAGESVFIAGGGPIGLLTLLAARHKGAGTVLVSEADASRRELAGRLGADAVIDPAAGAPDRVRELTDGLGSHLSVDCAGVAAAMDDCVAATRRGGRIVVAGTFERPYEVDLLRLLVQELSIIGTVGYPDEFPEAVELIVSGAIDVSPLVSEIVSLDDLPSVFERLSAGRDGRQKVLVRPRH